MQDNIVNISPLELVRNFFNPDTYNATSSRLFSKFNRLLSWETILYEGIQHDLLPFLYYIIKKNNYHLSGNTIHHRMLEQLKIVQHHYVARWLVQSSEKEKIFSLFSREGIAIIPLKGLAVAQFYPAPALRPMGDFDLLLHENDLYKAAKILQDKGYSLYIEEKNRIAAAQRDSHFHLTFTKKIMNTSVVIELHHALARKTFIKDNTLGFWTDARQPEGNIYSISYERLFLHLCWHFFQHVAHDLTFRMLWLIDIALILKHNKNSMDWNMIVNQAERWHIVQRIKLIFFLLEHFFNIQPKVPSNLLPKMIECKIYSKTLSGYTGKGPAPIIAIPLCLMEPTFLVNRVKLHFKARIKLAGLRLGRKTQ